MKRIPRNLTPEQRAAFIKRKKARRKRFWYIFIPLILMLSIVTYAAVLSNFKAPDVDGTGEIVLDENGIPISMDGAGRKKDFITVLLVGNDQSSNSTDTIMLATFDIANNKVNLLSIPRDTMTGMNATNKKINAAYTYACQSARAEARRTGVQKSDDEITAAGVEGLEKEVTKLVGFSPDKYAFIDLEGFEKIIDYIGGVEINVPMNMKYTDKKQNLYINLKKGVQTLNGKQAMWYVRYRKGYANADLGRIEAQQGFMKALQVKLTSPATLLKLPQIVSTVFQSIHTDLKPGELLWLANQAKSVPSENLITDMLPGSAHPFDKLSYYHSHPQETLTMINERYNPYINPIKNLNLSRFNWYISGGMSNSSPAATKKPATPAPTKKVTPTPSIASPVVTPAHTPVPTPTGT